MAQNSKDNDPFAQYAVEDNKQQDPVKDPFAQFTTSDDNSFNPTQQAKPSIMDKFPILGASAEIGKALQSPIADSVESVPAFAAGAAKGYTSNFADELAAHGLSALDLGKQAVQGQVPNMLGLPAKYNEYKKLVQQKQKELEDEHPVASALGNVAGIGAGIVTPGYGEYLSGAKLAKGAAGVSPKVAAFLAGKSPQAMEVLAQQAAGKLAPEAAELALQAAPQAGKLSQVAGFAANDALHGMGMGALEGAGRSESSITDPANLAGDIATGAAEAGIGNTAIGMGMRGTGNLAKLGYEGLNNIPLANKIKAQLKLGSTGIDPYTDSGRELQLAIAQKQIPLSETNKILNTNQFLVDNIQKAKEEAIKNNTIINIDPELKGTVDRVANFFGDNQNLINTIDKNSYNTLTKIAKGELGDLTSTEAFQLRKNFSDAIDNLQGIQGEAAGLARKEALKLQQALNNNIKEQIPEYADAAQSFDKFHSYVTETYLNPGKPLDAQTKFFTDLGKPAEQKSQLIDNIGSVLGSAKMTGGGEEKGKAVTGLYDLKKRLKMLEREDPSTFSQYSQGKSADEVIQNLQDEAYKAASIHQGQGSNPHEGIGKSFKGTLVGSGEGQILNLANRFSAMKQGISKPLRKLSEASSQELGGLADKLMGQKASSLVGQKLKEAIARKDEVGRTAALFTLMQQPQYREMIRAEGFDPGQGESK